MACEGTVLFKVEPIGLVSSVLQEQPMVLAIIIHYGAVVPRDADG
jgi:hypothetical protein